MTEARFVDLMCEAAAPYLLCAGDVAFFGEWGIESEMIDIAHYQSLARKRTASGALFMKDGMLLIVKPTYKDHWGIPGGVVDALESPHAACLRECFEELGIEVELDYMAVIDWMPEQQPGMHDSFQIIFMGKPLTVAQESQIQLSAAELAEWAYVPVEEALKRLSGRLAVRVRLALDNTTVNAAVYAENGVRV